jgi:hypothetical protein
LESKFAAADEIRNMLLGVNIELIATKKGTLPEELSNPEYN